MRKEPVKIKERDKLSRARDFEEVVLGFSEQEALEEASRCLQCKDPKCIAGCPVGIDIKAFIGQLTKKDYDGAYATIRQKSNFPSICGRVCPAEYQCRKACVFTKKGEPFASDQAINIHFLERFIGDHGAQKGLHVKASDDAKHQGMKVAVVGGGNSALEAVDDLIKIGEHVYLISLTPLTGDQVLIDKVKKASNLTIYTEHETLSMSGDNFVSAIKIKDLKTNGVKELDVKGIFVEIGLIPNSDLVKGVVPFNGSGEIEVNCICETGVPGLFAAGDVTNTPEKQIIIAAGEGAKAALRAHRYLQRLV